MEQHFNLIAKPLQFQHILVSTYTIAKGLRPLNLLLFMVSFRAPFSYFIFLDALDTQASIKLKINPSEFYLRACSHIHFNHKTATINYCVFEADKLFDSLYLSLVFLFRLQLDNDPQPKCVGVCFETPPPYLHNMKQQYFED
ncbi:CLUMA_CG003301, isoform A [Clunio marinus]|uniref:CLUMA_CG003301, isoform A n=1 Tax=Clunio marinus TaxID=568069 RepID=A0A1J1HN90_9DIPT|nr:CLUMA_CG003301, isoform A [Clunio marinus]